MSDKDSKRKGSKKKSKAKSKAKSKKKSRKKGVERSSVKGAARHGKKTEKKTKKKTKKKKTEKKSAKSSRSETVEGSIRIGVVINALATEFSKYATTVLVQEALERGHEVFYVPVDSLVYDPEEYVRALATIPPRGCADGEELVEAIQSPDADTCHLDVGDLDVLLLRNDPAQDAQKRPWAQSVGMIFGQIAVRAGVIVLNDPYSLAKAMNKLYFQFFPEIARPRTLITRNREEIRAFADQLDGNVVLKPLQGSGGEGVFVVRDGDASNLNQMIEAITRDGYVVAQEYLPEAAAGDLRLFLINGRPLHKDGHYAAIFRAAGDNDPRSNIHAGGTPVKAEVGERALRLAELVRPKLIEDGMFFVGLDIAGDKLMEVNVFSPGGLWSAEELEGVDFCGEIVAALERKVETVRMYGRRFDNVQIATI